MTAQHIYFPSGSILLEGLLERRPGGRGMVMAHPHPLYGGDMRNPVVAAVAAAYAHMGYSTLCFNFRGVGRSEGRYAEGLGEQEDVAGALTYLSEQGKTRLELGGYSFGAWVCASGLKSWPQVARLIMISPPVAFMTFDFPAADQRIELVIGAEDDEIAPPAVIRKQIASWNPDAIFEVIRASDHFYGGRTDAVASLVKNFLAGKLNKNG